MTETGCEICGDDYDDTDNIDICLTCRESKDTELSLYKRALDLACEYIAAEHDSGSDEDKVEWVKFYLTEVLRSNNEAKKET